MSSKRLRIAVIGCGFYAQNHLNAWRDLAGEGVEIVAVCDRDPIKAERAGRAFDAPWYCDAGVAFDSSRPDLADIVTRHDTHGDLVHLATAKACGFVVQKPLAADWAACCAITREGLASGLFNAVHENFRFQAPILRLRHLVATGAIGTPLAARITFATHYDVFRAQPYLRDETRLIMLDLGIHLFDLARVLLGEVAWLTCDTQKRRTDTAGEDTAFLQLRHKSGAVSQISCSFQAHRLPDCFPETLIEVEGADGIALLSPGGKIAVKGGGTEWAEDASTPLLGWTERPWHTTQESVLLFNRHILRAWSTGTAPETRLSDNIRTCALVEAAYRAAATGQSVAPPEFEWGEAA